MSPGAEARGPRDYCGTEARGPRECCGTEAGDLRDYGQRCFIGNKSAR